MYFASRMQAGRVLAAQLSRRYAGKPCAVLALSEGGVTVGAQISISLRCSLGMLVSQSIDLPREPEALGGISQDGSFAYNHAYSSGEIDEFVGEYYSLIEQQKLVKLREMHQQSGGLLSSPDALRGRNVILTADGLDTPLPLDLALEYLKPLSIERLIVALPLASVPVVDRIHVAADEIYCLSVVTDYISTEHYYDTNDVPAPDAVAKTIDTIAHYWQ